MRKPEKLNKLDYVKARALLDKTLAEAVDDALKGRPVVELEAHINKAIEQLFTSHTQAYREVLLGCILARLADKNIDVTLPYAGHGTNAFNGRILDEKVVNPFLHDQRIPCSKGPYLSVFRRSVQLVRETREGVRDKQGYDALLGLIEYLKSISSKSNLKRLLKFLICKFVELREASNIMLSRLQRISLEQYDLLISNLLATPSGGRFPVLFIMAAFEAIAKCFNLHWEISWQGINVADSASGAGGDITICSDKRILLAVEVTERLVDRTRVVSTFTTKISPSGIEDYLFFVKGNGATKEAKEQARQYFAQGHEVNFLDIKNWILMTLATLGKDGRAIFNRILLELLDSEDTPQSLKVAWNEKLNSLLG